MLELRCYPLARRFCRKIPADAGLDISLQLVKCDANAFSMRFAHALISTYEGCQRYALRGRKRRVPSRAVFHRTYFLSAPVHVFSRRLMAHELLAGHRMLAFGESCKVFLPHFAAQSPLFGQSAVPLASYLVASRVVVLAGVGKFFRVIRLCLARTQWL